MSTFKSAHDIDKRKKQKNITTKHHIPLYRKAILRETLSPTVAKATLSFGFGRRDVATCMA